jgi:uncharacterized protein (TIGR00725 family)
MVQLIDPIPVAVIGSSKSDPKSVAYASAFDVGFGIAKRGYAVLCGGRRGVMAAAAEGCRRAGGLCIGVLPHLDDKPNKYCSVVIATDLGSADDPISPNVSRNRIIVRAALCVFAIGGETGTANELRFAWQGGKYVFGLAGAPAPPPEGYTREMTWDDPSRRFLECGSVADALTAFDAFVRATPTFSTGVLPPR